MSETNAINLSLAHVDFRGPNTLYRIISGYVQGTQAVSNSASDPYP